MFAIFATFAVLFIKELKGVRKVKDINLFALRSTSTETKIDNDVCMNHRG